MFASVVLDGLTQHEVALLQDPQHLEVKRTEGVLDRLFDALEHLEHPAEWTKYTTLISLAPPYTPCRARPGCRYCARTSDSCCRAR